jgi:hypothetical protein
MKSAAMAATINAATIIQLLVSAAATESMSMVYVALTSERLSSSGRRC